MLSKTLAALGSAALLVTVVPVAHAEAGQEDANPAASMSSAFADWALPLLQVPGMLSSIAAWHLDPDNCRVWYLELGMCPS